MNGCVSLCLVVVGGDAGAGQGVDASAAEPVAGAFEGQDVGVVDDAVDHGGGDGLVAEDAAPAAERQVAGQDEGGVLVAGRDELEEQVRGVLLERQVADLVDDDQPVAAQLGEFAWQPTVPVGVGQAGDPVSRGGEQDAVAGVRGLDPQSGRQMRLAGSGWPQEDDVAGLVQERPRGEGRDLLPDGGLSVEVEVLQGLDRGEPGRADPQPGAGGVTGGDLALEDGGEVVQPADLA